MALAFPVGTFEPDPSAWSTRTVKGEGTPSARETRSGSVDVPAGSAFVGVAEVPERGWFGKIELNPSRWVDPDGASLCDVRELPTVLTRAWFAARELIEPACELADASVKRLDVARDFAVDRPSFFVQGLRPLPRRWARRSFTYNDPRRNLAETLFVGSGSGGVRLYDKHAERPETVAPGTLRWEAECRRRWSAEYGGIKAVGDINTVSVAELARNRWEWSEMGAEVKAMDRVVEVVATSGMSPAVQAGFLGYLLMQARGVAPALSHTTLAKYRRLQRQLGVAVTAESAEGVFVARLDWESGREVLQVA